MKKLIIKILCLPLILLAAMITGSKAGGFRKAFYYAWRDWC